MLIQEFIILIFNFLSLQKSQILTNMKQLLVYTIILNKIKHFFKQQME